MVAERDGSGRRGKLMEDVWKDDLMRNGVIRKKRLGSRYMNFRLVR